MNSKIVLVMLFMLGTALTVGACLPIPTTNEISIAEQPITLIPLNGPIANKKAELSGLAWHGDTLILLPQYPNRFGKDDGALFAIPKKAILDFLDGRSDQPITPTEIRFLAPALKDSIDHFEGYEGIGFSGENVYLTIESGKNEGMMGYLIGGKIDPGNSEIHIATSKIVPIPPPVLLDNRTDEGLIVTKDQVVTFFEANGTKVNSAPVAHVFGLDLSPQRTISFPNLEYRVTDATLDRNDQIWVINKVSPNDSDLLPASDLLAEKYGVGATHQKQVQVERLVQLNNDPSGITLADAAPIQLELTKEARNWEGLAALDGRGFLLVTDKSPETLLAFVPMP